MSLFEVYSVLSQYGTIIAISSNYIASTASVVYHWSEAVDLLKTVSVLPINNRRSMTIVWILDDRWPNGSKWYTFKSNQSDSLAVVPAPAQTDARHMLNVLNDVCIREIIETVVFEAVGLWEIAKVCTRFRYIARKVFEAKFRSKTCFYRTLLSDSQPLSMIEDFFDIFGASIKMLYVGQDYDSDTASSISTARNWRA